MTKLLPMALRSSLDSQRRQRLRCWAGADEASPANKQAFAAPKTSDDYEA